MKRFEKKDFIILLLSMTIYVINRFFLSKIDFNYITETILRYHFNDFLAPIVFMSFINIYIDFFRVDKKYKIKRLKVVMCLSIVCCIAWELVAPVILKRSTGDILDCLAYIMGAFLFWIIMRFRIA